MKKFFIFIFIMLLGLNLSGNANAISFIDPTFFFKKLDGTGSIGWSHDTPKNFSVPYDVVNSATLGMFVIGVDGNDDKITIEGNWTLNVDSQSQSFISGGWNIPYFGAVFDIAPVFNSWLIPGAPLDVVLNYDATDFKCLVLGKSVFKLDYDNGPAPTAVPEPGTILLLGTSLLGFIALGRKRFQNKYS